MRNPEWVNNLLTLVEEAKKESKEKPSIKEQIILIPKSEGLLWFEMLKDLDSIKNKKEIIPFPLVFQKICSRFSMKKSKAWNCLFFLAEFGLIDIIKYHGIKLNYKIIVRNNTLKL